MSDTTVAKPPRAAVAWSRWLPVGLILLACAWIFAPALHGGWMWDDRLDILDNPLLRTRAGLWKIWFEPTGLYDYYPLKFTIQWLQWHLWQSAPTGYHATNVALHATSALLVWRVSSRLGIRHGWLAGLIFAVHPLNVESVAWISELKNTLSLPLFLGAFERYLAFDAAHRRRDYLIALGLFLAAMLCKTSVVAFPVFLLLFAWWRRQRVVRRDLALAAPFFAVSFALGAVTWWFQRHAAIGGHDPDFNPVGGWLARLACAGTSAAFYVGKFLWPAHLMPIYPRWPVNPPPIWALLPWFGIAAFAIWFWRRRATWGRHAILGFGWFLLFAAPVLGFVTITSQRFSWVMDHLAYVPILGLIGLAAAAASAAIDRITPRWRWISAAGAVAVCTVAGIGSYRHARHFADEETLWTYNTRRNPTAWLAYFSLAKVEQESHRFDAAMADYATAIRLRPDYADAYYNLANTLRSMGRLHDAITDYREAIRFKPGLYLAHGNLAVVLAQSGDLDGALAECRRAVAIEPRYVDGQYNLGSLLVAAGHAAEALPHFAVTLQLAPAYPGAENNYAIALSRAGHLADAVPHFERALAQSPGSASLHDNLGNTLRELQRYPEAIAHLEKATALAPDSATTWFNLGCACAQGGKWSEAIHAFERALALKPDYADARANLAAVRRASGLSD